MGRKKVKRIAGINKSAEVRSYLGENPDAPLSQVVEAMKERGFDVSTSLITQVKSKLGNGRRRRRKKVARKGAAAQATATRQTTSGGLSATDLVEAKKLADQLGGIEQARRALETLEQLR